ncbi:MAG TPA: phosphoenolpyruvate synthase [Bdellovibrio sp.]|uniref:phosphoenolpyruvate synthase n=1 Tax=Bdellovibrio sp. TaxID=28201 RepID=UPI002EE31D9C
MEKSSENLPRILWLNQIHADQIKVVGGKTASLGEMYNSLSKVGIRVPNGFAITTQGFQDHLKEHNLSTPLKDLFDEINITSSESLSEKSYWARQLILTSPLPQGLEREILEAYAKLSAESGESETDVAVRSSATAEDLPNASFAGQQETYLNVRGKHQLLEACRRCFASLFTERAISYRNRFGFDQLKVSLSVCVQKMVRSDLACAGVMFTIDTETGFPNVVLISAAYGLGENVVQGLVTPDEYFVFKPTLKESIQPILRKELGSKETKLIYDVGGERLTRNIPVSIEDREQYVLSDPDILELARWGVLVEEHYSKLRGESTPLDIEWAKDGKDGLLYLVQARPETVHSRRRATIITESHLEEKGKLLIQGHSVGNKIGKGEVRVLQSLSDRDQLKSGEILVVDKTDPDWEPIMRNASAIITNSGSRTCHAAIVSRELGIPAIVGTKNATSILHNGQKVTVSCAEGEVGNVYDGFLKYSVEEVDVGKLERPNTKIMLNIADPAKAMALSFLPQDGVGLARQEFIITNYVKVHPLALIHFNDLRDYTVRSEIIELTKHYKYMSQYFVDKLSEGIAMIASAFYPKDVILRFSDFKTNEYSHLLGGEQFEPREENPMLGLRGASRYYHPLYQKGFALECQAIQRVRDHMGLTNLKVMVPFCRTPEEGKLVLAEMKKNGLIQGQNGLEVYVMCEIPSNVILAEQFADIFDGFSIGSNDLTQLVLGVDRESHLLSEKFDERNEAVKYMITSAIRTARKKGKKIGICGQAPSDYPEYSTMLVKEGIDSISLNADAILKTLKVILEEEKKRKGTKQNQPSIDHQI